MARQDLASTEATLDSFPTNVRKLAVTTPKAPKAPPPPKPSELDPTELSPTERRQVELAVDLEELVAEVQDLPREWESLKQFQEWVPSERLVAVLGDLGRRLSREKQQAMQAAVLKNRGIQVEDILRGCKVIVDEPEYKKYPAWVSAVRKQDLLVWVPVQPKEPQLNLENEGTLIPIRYDWLVSVEADSEAISFAATHDFPVLKARQRLSSLPEYKKLFHDWPQD